MEFGHSGCNRGAFFPMPYKDPEKQKSFRQKWYAKRRKEKKEFLDKIKKEPCSRCGKTFPPICMDLHHRNPNNKKDTISNLMNGTYDLSQLKLEVEKCELLCSNCHRLHHFKK